MLKLLVLLLVGTISLNAENVNLKKRVTAVGSNCFRRTNVPKIYIAKFIRFQYPDEDRVYNYLHCFWSTLGFWNDNTGFDQSSFRNLLKTAPYREELMSNIQKCNVASQGNRPQVRVHRSFICILNSSVGERLKKDIWKRFSE